MKTRNFNNKFLRGIWFNTPPDGVEIMEMAEAHTVFKIVDEWKFYIISVDELYEAVLNGNGFDCTEVCPRIKQVVKYEEV